jgi:prepilin-type processing-associated H-X9-DG protein
MSGLFSPETSLSALLGTWVLKVTLLLAAARFTAWLLSGASAAVRHLVWLAALSGALALPLVEQALPGWRIAWRVAAESAPAATTEPAGVLVEPGAFGAIPIGREAADPSAAAHFPLPWSWTDAHWAAALLLVWAAGSAVFAVRIIRSHLVLRRLARRRFRPIADGKIQALFDECRGRMGLARGVVLVSGGGEIGMPMTWGLWRPTVLLPEGAHGWGDQRLRAVLLHELAHVRRGDWLSVLLAQSACAVLWFHPLVWMAARALRRECEQAADDRVIAAGLRPSSYSSELLAMLHFFAQHEIKTNERNQTMLPSIPMAQPQTIERRIRALLDETRSRHALSWRACAGALAVTAAMLLPLAAVQLQAVETPPAKGAIDPTAPVDLSTPEAAVQTFVGALNRGDFAGAASAVHGGRVVMNADLAKNIGAGGPRFTISGVSASTQGEQATVTVGEARIATPARPGAANAEQPVSREVEHRLPLRREGGVWKIVPQLTEQPNDVNRVSTLLNIASALAASDDQVNRSRARAQETGCVNHLKQLALAVHMYADAHQGRLEFTAETVTMSLLPFLDGKEQLFACPTGEKMTYVFNDKLANRSISEITRPSETVLFYEPAPARIAAQAANGTVELGAAPLPHTGRTNVAFADGHVQSVTAEEMSKLRWEP